MYIKEKLRKLCLLLGFIGTAQFAVGDVLLQNFENSGETFLYMIKPTIADQPMWQLYFVLLTGAIAAPFMWLGLSAMHSHIKDRLNGKKSKIAHLLRYCGSDRKPDILRGAFGVHSADDVCKERDGMRCHTRTDRCSLWDIFSPLLCSHKCVGNDHGADTFCRFHLFRVQRNYRGSEGNVRYEHCRRLHHLSPCRMRTHRRNGKRDILAVRGSWCFPRNRADVYRGMLCKRLSLRHKDIVLRFSLYLLTQ